MTTWSNSPCAPAMGVAPVAPPAEQHAPLDIDTDALLQQTSAEFLRHVEDSRQKCSVEVETLKAEAQNLLQQKEDFAVERERSRAAAASALERERQAAVSLEAVNRELECARRELAAVKRWGATSQNLLCNELAGFVG